MQMRNAVAGVVLVALSASGQTMQDAECSTSLETFAQAGTVTNTCTNGHCTFNMSVTPSFAGSCSGHGDFEDAEIFLSGWDFRLVRSPGSQTVVKYWKLAVTNSVWNYATQTLTWTFVTEADNTTSYIDNYTMKVNFQIVGVMNQLSYIHRLSQNCSASGTTCDSQVVRTGLLNQSGFDYVGHSFKSVSVTASTGLPITDLIFEAKDWSQSGTDVTTDIRCALASTSVTSTSTACSMELVGLEGRDSELAELHLDRSTGSQTSPYATSFTTTPSPGANWYLCGLNYVAASFGTAAKAIWSRAGTESSDCGRTLANYDGDWFGFLGDTYNATNAANYTVDLRIVGTKLF